MSTFSINDKASNSRWVTRLLKGHRAVGLAVGALLYIVCLSGTLMVFNDEFKRWEQPGVAEFNSYPPQAVAVAAEQALERVDGQPVHHLNVALPIPSLPRMQVHADEQAWYADISGQLTQPVSHPLADFLEHVHFYLTLPGFWGLTVVGLLGVQLIALLLSGVLAHPRLLRDAFHLRWGRQALLQEVDVHNRLGVWGVPFHFTLALTGAAIGLASLAAVVLAGTYYAGDTAQVFAPIFGAEAEGDKTPAPLADSAQALTAFNQQYPSLLPWYVLYHDPATCGQSAEILAVHPRRVIYGDHYHFDIEGSLTTTAGMSDGAAGKQLVASFYSLHFGDYGTGVFGGLMIKGIYLLLGLTLCMVVAGGMNIWLLRRRQRGLAAPALERVWTTVVWGVPLMFTIVALMTRTLDVPQSVLVTVLWLGLAVLLLLASALRAGPLGERAVLAYWLRFATAVGLLGLVTVQIVTFGWSQPTLCYLGVNGALCAILFGLAGLNGFPFKTKASMGMNGDMGGGGARR